MKALITGASSGIGRDMAYILSTMGYDIIAVARREDKLKALKDDLKTNVEIVCCDVTDRVQCEKIGELAKDVDVFINNAGFGVFGNFDVTDLDAELRMLDLESRAHIDIDGINSPDTESYHSWSSNSQWVVFSSRRDNGLYTLPYICRIGKDGKPAKPFLLPQENPDTYDYLLYSYNIPELTKGRVEVSPYEIEHAAKNLDAKQIQFK